MCLWRELEDTKTKGRIVYVSGIFDLFHVGHLNFLERAKGLGDILIVGVITDEFMMTYKGKSIIPFEQRQRIVDALECVNYTIAVESFDGREIAEKYNIDIRVITPEYGRYQGQYKAYREMVEKGIEYVVLSRTPDISTTKIKEDCCEKLVFLGACPCGIRNQLSGS